MDTPLVVFSHSPLYKCCTPELELLDRRRRPRPGHPQSLQDGHGHPRPHAPDAHEPDRQHQLPRLALDRLALALRPHGSCPALTVQMNRAPIRSISSTGAVTGQFNALSSGMVDAIYRALGSQPGERSCQLPRFERRHRCAAANEARIRTEREKPHAVQTYRVAVPRDPRLRQRRPRARRRGAPLYRPRFPKRKIWSSRGATARPRSTSRG